MGRHSNIILLDPASGTILDGINHVTPAISTTAWLCRDSPIRIRRSKDKLNPLETLQEAFRESLSDERGAGRSMAGRRVQRLSPLAAQEIANRAGKGVQASLKGKKIAEVCGAHLMRSWNKYATINIRRLQASCQRKVGVLRHSADLAGGRDYNVRVGQSMHGGLLRG